MCGIVLAGSHRWGDSRFERVLRGPLLPVAQTPLICFPLAWLRDAGVRESIVCANSQTAFVRASLGAGREIGITLDYVEDIEPRGPAGSARDASLRSGASTFVVVEGALIPSLDLAALLDVHRSSGAAATVVVEVDRRQREVTGDKRALPGGIYVFERRVLERVADRGYQDIKQGLLERLHADRERVRTHVVQGLTPRVIDYATYASVNQWLINSSAERPTLLSDYRRTGGGLRHPTAVVDPSARLIGPVLLGARSRIEAGAVIVGPTSIGADSLVGQGTLVARSVVWERCVVGPRAVIDSAMLADGAWVAEGEHLTGVVQVPDTVRTPSFRVSRVPPPLRAPIAALSHSRPRPRPVALPPNAVPAFGFGELPYRTSGEHPTLA